MNEAGQIEAHGGDIRVFRGDAKTPLFGSVTRDGDVVRFAPSLPLVPGETYRVELQTADGAWRTHSLALKPAQDEAPTVSITPSPTVLPANALKLYLHFSQPMEQGVFLDRIRLFRKDGTEVTGPFRETELWSPDGQRLTLWLHPGRQKTGVNLNTEEGPVLVAGESYTLEIAPSWRSASAVPLGKPHTFRVQASAPDHACPEPRRWQITAPRARTREPLLLRFDEPLDPAMLQSALRVQHAGQVMKGSVSVPPASESWSFVPAESWQPGRYEITIDPLLEDLAGNNLQHPFEVDRDQQPPPPNPNPVTLGFEAR
jgi:hypothetical protein